MFNTYEFVFAGISSAMYGLMVCDIGSHGQSDVAFGNKASIIEARTLQRITPIHFGVDYNEAPLEFKLVFGSERALDRYELESISMWLTGHQQYQWLSIEQPDLQHVQFRCLVTSLTPITHGWLPVAFEANIRCDCPYAYGFPFAYTYDVSGSKSVLLRNNGSVNEYMYPQISIRTSSRNFSVVNKSDNSRKFLLSGMPSGNLDIRVDNASRVIAEKTYGHNLYRYFDMNFFRLVPGDNELEITGTGTVTFSGRFLHNVGA